MSATTIDITSVMDDAALKPIHVKVLLISILVALVDGFDNQALAFTAPAIATAWGAPPLAFATAFSGGLAGMLVGSLMFGEIADRYGRRFVFIWATILFGLVTLLVPLSQNITHLVVFRFIGGLGLGGLPVVMASLISEYTPRRLRASFGNWAFIGIPAGGFVGGLLASHIVPNYGWQAIYLVGGSLTLAIAAIAAMALPESPSFLLRKDRYQSKARQLLAQISPQFDPDGDAQLVSGSQQGVKTSIVSAFRDGRGVMTALFWAAELILLMGFYVLVNWVPTLLVSSGLPMQTAVLGSAALNIGGLVLGLVLGRLCDRFGARQIVSLTFLLGAASLLLATQSVGNVPLLMASIFLAGGAWIGGQGAMVVLIVNSYPVSIRSIAVGWALTVGRVGAIASPAVVGIPLSWNWPATSILLLPVLPAVIGAIAVFLARPYGAPAPLDPSADQMSLNAG